MNPYFILVDCQDRARLPLGLSLAKRSQVLVMHKMGISDDLTGSCLMFGQNRHPLPNPYLRQVTHNLANQKHLTAYTFLYHLENFAITVSSLQISYPNKVLLFVFKLHFNTQSTC